MHKFDRAQMALKGDVPISSGWFQCREWDQIYYEVAEGKPSFGVGSCYGISLSVLNTDHPSQCGKVQINPFSLRGLDAKM